MRGWLAQGSCSIVAGRALSNRGGVMGISGGGPCRCRLVAGIALRRGADVGGGLDLCVDRQISTAMAD